jgi:RimJ/RimL family protein N-acetyltransferase
MRRISPFSLEDKMVEERQIERFSPDQSQDWWSLTRKSSILLTDSLILRKLQSSDAKPMAKLANNIAVSSMTARLPHPYTVDDAVQFIAQAELSETRGCTYAITLAKSAELIGCCSLNPTEREIGPSLGYWLGKPWWGNGYATEAAHAMVDLAFKTTSRERVNASCRVTNRASRRVLEKCGFQHSDNGMIHSQAVGSTVPVDYYVLDRNTWISLKSWGNNS